MAITHRSQATCRVQNAPTFSTPLVGGANTDNVSDRHFDHGTGSDQCDVVYDASHTIDAGGNLSLDLATGGGLLQPDGSAVAMVKLKSLMVRKTGGTGTFEVEIPANGILHLAASGDKTQTFASEGDAYMFISRTGVTVTAVTADLLQIDEVGGAATVTVHVTALGDSA